MRMPAHLLRRSLPCLLLLACGVCAQPRQQVLQLDAQRSHAGFEVKVLWLIGVHGQFGSVHGTVTIDHFRGTAKVDAWINTDDLHMRSDKYTQWARSAEFFDARHFPQLHFVSTDFPLVRMRDGGSIDGTLSIRGIDRPVRLTLDKSECAEPLSGRCAVRASGEIQRRDFGMNSHRHSLSGDVSLEMSIFVTQASASPTQQ